MHHCSCETLENMIDSTQTTQVNSRAMLPQQSDPCANLISVLINISEYISIFNDTFWLLQVLVLISSLRFCIDPVCSGHKRSGCHEKLPSSLKWTCESSKDPSRRCKMRQSFHEAVMRKQAGTQNQNVKQKSIYSLWKDDSA